MASEDDSKIGEMKTRVTTDFTNKDDGRELRLTSSKEKEENK